MFFKAQNRSCEGKPLLKTFRSPSGHRSFSSLGKNFASFTQKFAIYLLQAALAIFWNRNLQRDEREKRERERDVLLGGLPESLETTLKKLEKTCITKGRRYLSIFRLDFSQVFEWVKWLQISFTKGVSLTRTPGGYDEVITQRMEGLHGNSLLFAF